MIKRSGVPAAFAGALLVGAVTVAGCGSDGGDTTFSGYERTPTPQVGDLTLPAVAADGTEIELAMKASDGKVMLVYFGYTNCPDICPTTLSDVRQALGDLGDDASKVELTMVSIDPKVDTPEILGSYVRSFVPDATAVSTLDDARLRAAAEGFGADYGKEEVDGKLQPFHTTSLYAVDPEGDLVLSWTFGTKPADLAADLRILLERVA
ncbi:MAG: SCO family protein [Acidimicrobiia bacterium]|nr:SCO family protein [Acidimicrobiia bacterium]MDH4363845.1 SCO family protein [Acidimicrobiia bacterium]